MKKLIVLMSVLFTANLGQVFAQTQDCTVGHIGPGGGYIFFCDDVNNKKLPLGKVGLEAAQSDQPILLQWGKYIVTPVSINDVGGGLLNTRANIISQGAGLYASLSCYMLNNTNDRSRDFDADWFLPAPAEVQLMYTNLKAANPSLGGFTEDQYWTSSDADSELEFYCNFNKGSHHPSHAGSVWSFDGDKQSLKPVRCVRAF